MEQELGLNKLHFSMCAATLADQVFVSGGELSSTVHCLTIDKKLQKVTREQMPNLNVARRDHASCAVGNSIFVFCGTIGERAQSLNTIERLNLSRGSQRMYWQLIRTPAGVLAPRY